MSGQKIQLFVPTYRVEECLAGIRECLEVGWTGLGFKTIEFEALWKAYTKLPYAHFLGSATAGLHLAVRILKKQNDWSEGDEIISTPITFVSTNHAVKYEGMNVVMADVDDTGCLDAKSVEERITSRTRAVIFVGLGGNVGQYDEIVSLCRRNKIKLILDAAHMAGTRVKGRIPGADADVVVYSFQAVKNLPTADSGMICFADEANDKLARQQSWLGIDKDTFSRSESGGTYKWFYDVPDLGYKYHGNSIMAALAITQLKYLDQDNAYRRQVAAWYESLLRDIPQLRIVPVGEDCESSRHLFQVRVPRRDEVLLALNNCGIYPGVHYRDNTEYDMYAQQPYSCPNARKFSDEVMSLPLHLRMTRDNVEWICTELKTILSKT